jgi:hypothetical protein
MVDDCCWPRIIVEAILDGRQPAAMQVDALLKLMPLDWAARPTSRALYQRAEVKDDLNRSAELQEPLPDLVINGFYLLGYDWRETAKAWEEAGFKTPPVMITLANRTETAARTSTPSITRGLPSPSSAPATSRASPDNSSSSSTNPSMDRSCSQPRTRWRISRSTCSD